MNPLRKIGGILLVGGAALAGNWVGESLRATVAGVPRRRVGVLHTTDDGATVLGFSVTLTNLVPALLIALLAGRPRSLYAFIGGALISALVGDTYERSFVMPTRQDAILTL